MVHTTALLLLCWSAAVGGGEAPAAPQRPLSLSDCIAVARCTHEDVLIAAQRVREAHAGLRESQAAQAPNVSLDATWAATGRSTETAGETGTTLRTVDGLDAALNITWSVFDLRRPKLIEKARKLEDQSRAGALGMLRDLDRAVANAYADLRRAVASAELERQILEMDLELLRIARARQTIGDGTAVDVVQAEAEAALAAQQVLAADNAAQKARLTLLSSMGLSDDTGYEFALEGPPVEVELPALAECLDRAYDTRDDIRGLQRALDISHVDVALARLARHVSFRVQAGGAQTFAPSEAQGSSYQVAFTMALPLFDGGAARNALRAAEARRIISEADVAAALRTVWLEVSSSYRDVESTRRQVEAARVSEAAAQRSLEKTQTAFRIGLASFSSTLDARLQYCQARRQVIEAEAALYRAYWSLHRAAPETIEGLTGLPEPSLDAPGASRAPAVDEEGDG